MVKHVYGLIGYPIEHSQSPRLFQQSNLYKSGAHYRLFPLKGIQDLPQLLEHYKPRGLNVTSPHKEEVLKHIPRLECSREVEAIQSANVLSFCYDKGGCVTRARAYNTDVIGFRNSLVPLLGGVKYRALILGTGGAARAVALTLDTLNIPYCFVSRRPNSVILPDCLKGTSRVLGYQDLGGLIPEYNLIIHATPLGRATEEAPDIPYHLLRECTICYDLNYSDHPTSFLSRSRDYGLQTIDGKSMLYQQALEAWRIWERDALGG